MRLNEIHIRLQLCYSKIAKISIEKCKIMEVSFWKRLHIHRSAVEPGTYNGCIAAVDSRSETRFVIDLILPFYEIGNS